MYLMRLLTVNADLWQPFIFCLNFMQFPLYAVSWTCPSRVYLPSVSITRHFHYMHVTSRRPLRAISFTCPFSLMWLIQLCSHRQYINTIGQHRYEKLLSFPILFPCKSNLHIKTVTTELTVCRCAVNCWIRRSATVVLCQHWPQAS